MLFVPCSYSLVLQPRLVHSPNIDALARLGVELTDYHVYKVCSPTRAARSLGLFCHP